MTQTDASTFICGVVEGFYGRPWTIEQRKRLFARMREFGMNTYLYAPKDDSKHRLYWRDLYLVEEAEALRELIDACAEYNINFVYAISPGLDIAYSSQKEQAILKRTSVQVPLLPSIRTGKGSSAPLGQCSGLGLTNYQFWLCQVYMTQCLSVPALMDYFLLFWTSNGQMR
jgi:hypothetical protein